MSSSIYEIGLLIFGRLPHLALLVVGLIMAIARRHRAPHAMRLIAIGCGLAIFSSIASQAFFVVFPRYYSVTNTMVYFQLASLFFSLMSTGSMLVILLGAFAERNPQETRGFAVVLDSAPPPLPQTPGR